MIESTKTNNERLRDLVTATGLSQPDALLIFNRKLGPAAYSINTWKAFLASPQSSKFRPINDALLKHAEKSLSK